MPRKDAGKSGQFVVPGDRLAVIEELISGPGTYVSRDGTINSAVTGRVAIDAAKRTVSVNPKTRLPVLPREGSIVIGKVATVQDKVAIAQIFKINNTPITSKPFIGSLHVSSASSNYVKSMFDVFKAEDIIRARVASDKNSAYQLSTADGQLGVLYAFCSRCGNALEKKGWTLQCPVCKNLEERKLAPDYGEAEI